MIRLHVADNEVDGGKDNDFLKEKAYFQEGLVVEVKSRGRHVDRVVIPLPLMDEVDIHLSFQERAATNLELVEKIASERAEQARLEDDSPKGVADAEVDKREELSKHTDSAPPAETPSGAEVPADANEATSPESTSPPGNDSGVLSEPGETNEENKDMENETEKQGGSEEFKL